MKTKLLIILAWYWLVCPWAAADFLLIEGQADPVYGVIESKDDLKIRFSVFQADTGSFQPQDFAPATVIAVVQTVEPQRLEQLSVERLAEYRDYAEELSAFRADPVARDLALRLTLICLYHADRTGADGGRGLSASAATILPGLARNGNEKRQFELIAKTCNPGFQSPDVAESEDDRSATASQSRLQLVQLMRREQFDQAQAILDTLSRPERFSVGSVTGRSLQSAIAERRIPPRLMWDLITAEIRLRGSGEGAPIDLADQSGWAWDESHLKHPDRPIWIPGLSELTRFDLEKTQYQGGRWMRPTR